MLARIATHDYGPGRPRQVIISLTRDAAQADSLRESGVEVYSLGMRSGIPSPFAFVRLVRLLRRFQPTVLITWLYHSDLLGTLAGRVAGVPRVVWNVRCSEVDFTHYARSTELTVRLLSRMSGWPWAVATNSMSGRASHERLGYHPARWLHLPNGFDTDEWHPNEADRAEVRAELGLFEGDVLVGMIARVDPLKDHGTFLAAAVRVGARFSRARFVLIGKGTELLAVPGELRAKLYCLGERFDVQRQLRAFDIAVLSSIAEGFPNVIGEAMATGVPCVVTDVGDAATIVGETGYVVPPRDPEALGEAIGKLIENGATTRVRLGRLARQRIADGWSIQRVAKNYEQLWRVSADSPGP